MRDKTALKDKDESSLLRSTKVPIDPSRRDTKPLRSTVDIAAEIAGYIRQIAPPDVLYSLSGKGDSDFRKYREKPSLFAKEILGIDFCDQQKQICDLVLDNRFVVVEAGHSVGKTVTSACLVIWWLSVHESAKVLTSAPTNVQVNRILWQYVRQYKDHAKVKIPGEVFLTPRWDISSDRLGIGLSPKKTSEVDVAALQGFHHPNLLVVLDEAAGLTTPLWNAATSLVSAENNRLLAIGNPVARTGPFYDATQSPIYRHVRISCLDHPNVKEKREVVSGAVSWSWVNERVQDWCKPVDTRGPKTFEWENKLYDPLPVFESRVLGRPPDESDQQFIPLSWVQAAEAAWLEGIDDLATGERVIGLDPASTGSNESAMCFRIGDSVRWIKRRHGNDTIDLSNWLMQEITDNNTERVYVDITGGYGSGVVDTCNISGYLVEGVNFSSAAMQRNRFANQRHELWWGVRERLRLGKMQLPEDSILEADLISPCWQKHDAQGRTVIESKDDIKKRLGRSPDSADSLAVSYANSPLESDGTSQPYAEQLTTSSIARERGESGGSRWRIDKVSTGRSRWRL